VRGEPGGEQRRPKPVARARKVMTNSRSVEPGIDATKKYAQTWRDDVPDSLALGCE